MPTAVLATIVVAVIGALSAVLGAVLVFIAKARFDHPIAKEQADISAGTLILSQVTYLNSLIPLLQKEVAEQADQLENNRKDCEQQIEAVRTEAEQRVAKKDEEIDELRKLTANLLLRLERVEVNQGHA